jgi:N-acetylneuraminic acid mutarotase
MFPQPVLLRALTKYAFLCLVLMYLPSCDYFEELLPLEPKPEAPVDKWEQKQSFPFYNAEEWENWDPIETAFAIGDKAYLFMNRIEYPDMMTDIFEYDPVSDSFTRKTTVEDILGYGGVNFVINGKGYIFGENSFWEYDPSTNVVQQKAPFPGKELSMLNRFSFAIHNKGYVGGGRFTDFWEYNPVSDTWAQKADLPDGERMYALGLSVNNRGYLLLGSNYDTSVNHVDQIFHKTVWEYLPQTNKWVKKKDFPGNPRNDPASFTIKNRGYVGLGDVSPGGLSGSIESNPQFFTDFWSYDPLNDSWTKVAEFPGRRRFRPVGFSVLNKGYAGFGEGNSRLPDLWEYIP